MSHVDNRLQNYWNFATCLHRTGAQSWLTFLENMARTEVGIAQQAALRLLSKRKKDKNDYTG